MNNTNYVSLVEQKTQLIKKLSSLNARQFAAQSNFEMEQIARERKDTCAALDTINELISPKHKTNE